MILPRDTYELNASKICYSTAKKQILNNISLKINNKKIVGFLGPNGAGKTTFFSILAGLVPAKSGKISVQDQDVTHLPIHKRVSAGIGFLPQKTSIFLGLTVKQNLKVGLELSSRKFNHATQETAIEEMLEKFNLAHLRNHLGASLSGGECRRVELARCLICEPKFILLDEPFAGIDPITIQATKSVLKHIHAMGTGIIISDHNTQDTLDLCDYIFLLNNGEILSEGTPEEIQKNVSAQSMYFGTK